MTGRHWLAARGLNAPETMLRSRRCVASERLRMLASMCSNNGRDAEQLSDLTTRERGGPGPQEELTGLSIQDQQGDG